MKRLLRTYVFTLFALWATIQFMHPSLMIGGTLETFLLSTGILSLLTVVLKPILKLLLLPLNIATLGLFTLVINMMIFFLFLKLVPEITLTPWTFPGFSFQGVVIPTKELNFWGSLFVASFSISVITNALAYLAD